MQTYWLSFCDPAKPAGSQFLGVAIVEATSVRDAIKTAWAHGCNPGGEVQTVALPPIDRLPEERARLLAETPFNTLMDRAELERRGLVLVGNDDS